MSMAGNVPPQNAVSQAGHQKPVSSDWQVPPPQLKWQGNSFWVIVSPQRRGTGFQGKCAAEDPDPC